MVKESEDVDVEMTGRTEGEDMQTHTRVVGARNEKTRGRDGSHECGKSKSDGGGVKRFLSRHSTSGIGTKTNCATAERGQSESAKKKSLHGCLSTWPIY